MILQSNTFATAPRALPSKRNRAGISDRITVMKIEIKMDKYIDVIYIYIYIYIYKE